MNLVRLLKQSSRSLTSFTTSGLKCKLMMGLLPASFVLATQRFCLVVLLVRFCCKQVCVLWCYSLSAASVLDRLSTALRHIFKTDAWCCCSLCVIKWPAGHELLARWVVAAAMDFVSTLCCVKWWRQGTKSSQTPMLKLGLKQGRLKRLGLEQCFSNFFIPSPPFHSRHVVFTPPSLTKKAEDSKFEEFYWKKVLNSWTKQLYYDANITFRIIVKIIYTGVGHADDPG